MIFDMKEKKLYRDLEDWIETDCPVEDCNDCPIGCANNGKKIRCSQFVKLYPDSALRLLWDSVKEVQSEAEIQKELEDVEMGNMENVENMGNVGTVKENQEEKKMSLKIIDENSSLKEVLEFCKSREECRGCPVRGIGFCRVNDQPDNWDLTFSPSFTDDELAWMRVMSAGLTEDNRMWLGRDSLGILYWKIEGNNSESRVGYLPQELFPQIQPGQRYELREVLR